MLVGGAGVRANTANHPTHSIPTTHHIVFHVKQINAMKEAK